MLDLLEIFLLVAQKGSLAAAARTLDVAPSTVSKRLAALEEHFGVRLLQRTTRRLSLTQEGRLCFDEAKALLARVEGLERRLASRTDEPIGRLRITTIHAFGQMHLARVLPRFHERYPDIELELKLTDRVVDLVDEAFDVAIRFGALPDSSLRARRLGRNLYYLCASPGYLEARGWPRRPSDLRDHACLTDAAYPLLRRWVLDEEGARVSIEPRGPLFSDDPVVRYHAAVGGMGIAALPGYMTGPAVERGELLVVLDGQTLDLGTIWALHVSRDYVPARLAVFLDFIVEELADQRTETIS